MLPDPLFLTVHMYGIMIAVGILCAFAVLYIYSSKKKIEKNFTDFIFYNGVASIVVGFVSASLFQSLYDFIENPNGGFHLSQRITFIGGLIGGVACFLAVYFIFRNKFKARLYRSLSIIPACITVGHAFGRIGCFFAGCCHGSSTDSFLGVVFPNKSQLGPVHPTQLYEAAFLFLLFGICSFLVLKLDFKHNLSLYLIAYGVFRFFIEYLRGDDRGEFLGDISPSQFWSILMVVAGIGLVFLIRRCYKKEDIKSKKRI